MITEQFLRSKKMSDKTKGLLLPIIIIITGAIIIMVTVAIYIQLPVDTAVIITLIIWVVYLLVVIYCSIEVKIRKKMRRELEDKYPEIKQKREEKELEDLGK
jgi:L-asparagine transporter-like permease